MPIHDWTRVKAGIFHDFHTELIVAIKFELNRLLHGSDYYALAEQFIGAAGPDMLTLQRVNGDGVPRRPKTPPRGGPAVLTAPPKFRFHVTDEPTWFASLRKKSVVIRHVSEDRPVAVLEVVSRGNKESRGAFNFFVTKVQDLLAARINVSLVDLFPPTRRDPQGIHPPIWGDDDGDFRFDPTKPLTCVAYVGAAAMPQAFIDPVAVGDRLPDLPVFLTGREYVPTPLEAAYEAAFARVQEPFRTRLEQLPPQPKRPKRR